MSASLCQLVYCSEVELTGDATDVEMQVRSIVEHARARNRAEGLTGALVIAEGVFVQILEGSLNAIEAVFERICRDQRHRRVRLLELTQGQQRTFGDWAMASITPDGELSRLCTGLEERPAIRAKADSAAELIKAMRSLAGAGCEPSSSSDCLASAAKSL